MPCGGGSVTFASPVKKNLRPVQFIKPGKVCKVRGLAYVCKVSPSIASRMVFYFLKIYFINKLFCNQNRLRVRKKCYMDILLMFT